MHTSRRRRRVKSNRIANLVNLRLIRIDGQSSFDPWTNFEKYCLAMEGKSKTNVEMKSNEGVDCRIYRQSR